MEFTREDEFDEDDKPKGINKFKKIGTTIKLVSSLSTKIVPDMGDRPSMDSVRDPNLEFQIDASF